MTHGAISDALIAARENVRHKRNGGLVADADQIDLPYRELRGCAWLATVLVCVQWCARRRRGVHF